MTKLLTYEAKNNSFGGTSRKKLHHYKLFERGSEFSVNYSVSYKWIIERSSSWLLERGFQK